MDFSSFRVSDLKEYAKEHSITLPGGLRKAEIVAFLEAADENEVKGYRDSVITLRPKKCSAEWKKHLEKHGWCTVPIEDAPVEKWRSMFFDWMENACEEFRSDDHETWKVKNMVPLLHGIIKHHFGHGALRYQMMEKCAHIFAELYNIEEEDLLASFDGGCFLNSKTKKSRSGNLKFNLKDLWLHNDTPRLEHFSEEAASECYQGFITLTDCGKLDGGLVLAKSKNWRGFFGEYMENHPTAGFKWTRAETEDPIFDDVEYVKVCAPAGHLVLWNGLLFHCNVPPSCEDPSRYRMCVYLSMQPRVFATEEELEKRIKLREEGRMTGHWCYGPFFAANAVNPRTYGNIVPTGETKLASLNYKRARFVGYDDWTESR